MEGIDCFKPNEAMDKNLQMPFNWQKEGVHILAYNSIITKDEINIGKSVEILI